MKRVCRAVVCVVLGALVGCSDDGAVTDTGPGLDLAAPDLPRADAGADVALDAPALDAVVPDATDAALDGPVDAPALDTADAALEGPVVLDAMADAADAADGPVPDGLPQPDWGFTDGGVALCPNPPLVPPASGTCTVQPGGSAVLLRGELLLPDQVLHNGHLLVDQGKIACVGCDCSGHPAYPGATVVACAKGVISPGLINGHDHLEYCQASPAVTSFRYDHRNEWRTGANGKPKISYSANASADGVKWGELRMVLGGATSIMGVDAADKLLRNLDQDNEGLGKPTVVDTTFPLGDLSGILLAVSCNYPSLPSESTIKGANAWVAHVAEGVIQEARNEFLCLSGQQAGGVDGTLLQSAFIHAVGLTATDAIDMALGGTTTIWSPRSNISLYGFTANVVMFHNLAVRIALGTDWTASGSMNLLRELACADHLNQTHYNGFFSDKQLWEMVTVNAATANGVEDVVGQLLPGTFADIAIFDGSKQSGHAAVVRAGVADVVLVMRGGEVLHGDDALVQALVPQGGQGCEPLSVCNVSKRVCLERETGMTLAQLQSAVGSATYPLFFCGVPPDEPTCVPSRPGAYDGTISATDADGDGVPDSSDNCPKIFNPPRPMDQGLQPDADKDGEGDACDPCPLHAGAAQCPVQPTASDSDGDTIADALDNCPKVFNKDQLDADNDQVGDVCDFCPRPNVGGGGCPYLIKELRDPSLGVRPPDEMLVLVQNATVTAIRTTIANNYGYYLREGVQPYEAIFVYTKNAIPADSGGTPLKLGDVITLAGTFSPFQTIDELTDPAQVTVTGSGLIDPVDTTTDKLQPGSASAEGLESHLVRVSSVTVAAKLGTTTDAFWVSDSGATCSGTAPVCAKVTDYFYDGGVVDNKPAASVGQTFTAIVGVIDAYKNDHTLQPRSDADLVTP